VIDFSGRAVPDWMLELMAARGARAPSKLTPGPDDPAVPRALKPLDAPTAARAAAVLDRLAARFDKAEDKVEDE
jgi:hypothetical protein